MSKLKIEIEVDFLADDGEATSISCRTKGNLPFYVGKEEFSSFLNLTGNSLGAFLMSSQYSFAKGVEKALEE